MPASKFYNNPNRLGNPFVFQNRIMFEHQAGEFDRQTRNLREFVSCAHIKSPTSGRQFGGGLCMECSNFIQNHEDEIEQAMKKEGWK